MDSYQGRQEQGELLILLFMGMLGIFIVIGLWVKYSAWRKRVEPKEARQQEEILRAEYEAAPRCICGGEATDRMPYLERSRGASDWLRNIYGAPPRYKRVIDYTSPPVLCRAHAHLADSLMDKFIFNRIRAAYSDLNAQIAAESAAFEQESLYAQLVASLTENQKRAQRKAGPSQVLRMLPAQGTAVPPKNGTDGEEP